MHSINRSGARRPRNGNQALALVSVVSRKSSAARAAHREQARSYIRFGPITPASTRATALFVPRAIELEAKGPRAPASGITGPKQM